DAGPRRRLAAVGRREAGRGVGGAGVPTTWRVDFGVRLWRATWARDACGGRIRNRFAEAFVAAQILVAAFIDGDCCLTDLAAKKHFRCKRGTAWLTSRSTARVGGEGKHAAGRPFDHDSD